MDRGIRWRLCDPILVSRIDGLPEILPKLSTTRLTTKDGNPQTSISDHLPVQLRINLG
jgi:hypothetical protein